MMSQQQKNEIDAEYREERARESQETHFDSWFSDNKHDLVRDFAKENKILISDVEVCEDEFNEFVREEYKLYEDSK